MHCHFHKFRFHLRVTKNIYQLSLFFHYLAKHELKLFSFDRCHEHTKTIDKNIRACTKAEDESLNVYGLRCE